MKSTLSIEGHKKLVALVIHYESLHDGDLSVIGLQPKMCPAGYWTEGYGSLVLDDKGQKLKGIGTKALAYKFAKIHTENEAINALVLDLEDYEERVLSLKISLNENQLISLVSFCYNVGFGAFKKSKFIELVKSKANPKAIDEGFRSFNKCNGEEMKGLTYRRMSEAMMYITGELKFFN